MKQLHYEKKGGLYHYYSYFGSVLAKLESLRLINNNAPVQVLHQEHITAPKHIRHVYFYEVTEPDETV